MTPHEWRLFYYGFFCFLVFLAILWTASRMIDDRRKHRAWLAYMDSMRSPAEIRSFKATIVDWGEGYAEKRWRWVIFDAEPDYDSSRVEGVLVPYALGNEPTEEAAQRAAHYSFTKWVNTRERPEDYTLLFENDSVSSWQ